MALEQLDLVHRLVAAYPDTFALATSAAEAEAAFRGGRIASLIGLEGGSMIASSLPVLRTFHARGVRYLTLTHWRTTRWADAATDEPRHGGLTPFGVEVVREMNRLGMLVDLSHVSPDTMAAALDATEAPVIFSHSGARAVADHPRNVPDRILRRVSANGGVVMAVFLSHFVSEAVAAHVAPGMALEDAFLAEHPDASDEELGDRRRAWLAANPGPVATIADVADHIDHLARVAGVEHVGIGSDFDGGELLPVGLEDVAGFPRLIAELLRRGYSDAGGPRDRRWQRPARPARGGRRGRADPGRAPALGGDDRGARRDRSRLRRGSRPGAPRVPRLPSVRRSAPSGGQRTGATMTQRPYQARQAVRIPGV